MPETDLLFLDGLVKHFPIGGGVLKKPTAWVKAVDGVTIGVRKGESFGLVGESGCGKSTVGRLILKLLDPTDGRIVFSGEDITRYNRQQMRPLRNRLQIIFQDPYASLDPRMKVEAIVTEPLRADNRLGREARRNRAVELLDKVGLRADDLKKYPHEFSGGQRQRIGIARALAGSPELVVADEPVSALDVSIQAQVINLLEDLQDEFSLSYLFISHDLSVVEHVCNRIGVMYLGRIVETARTESFSTDPRHPYTRALLDAVPMPDPHLPRKKASLEGDVPSPIDPPPGCAFHPRCPHKMVKCSVERPPSFSVNHDHTVACWLEESTATQGEGP